MGQDLQAPGTDDAPNWGRLYRARGPDEVVLERPILTGDVFVDVPVLDDDRLRDLIVLQHPCSIRRGTSLNERILCAEIIPARVTPPSEWVKWFKIMPLPELRPTSKPQNYEARFDRFHIAEAQALLAAERIACLDLVGIDLFLQRWVHQNARVVVPTSDYYDATISQYEEADIIEDWCLSREDVSAEDAAIEADAWLSQQVTIDETRRDQLKYDEHRSRIRRDARFEVLRLNAELP